MSENNEAFLPLFNDHLERFYRNIMTTRSRSKVEEAHITGILEAGKVLNAASNEELNAIILKLQKDVFGDEKPSDIYYYNDDQLRTSIWKFQPL